MRRVLVTVMLTAGAFLATGATAACDSLITIGFNDTATLDTSQVIDMRGVIAP